MDTAAIKVEIEKVATSFEEFKAQHTRELDEIKKKGFVTAEQKEQLERVESVLGQATEMKERLERVETALNRTAIDPEKKDMSPEQIEYSETMARYMRHGNREDELKLRALEGKAISIGSDPAGGYWVEPKKSARIVEQMFETSPIRSIATIESISNTNELLIAIDRDDVTATWAGETTARAETTTPTIGEKSIRAHEIYAKPKASQQALEDMQRNPEEWLARKVSSRFGRAENTAFVTGSGTIQPRGLLTQTLTEQTVLTTQVAWGAVGFTKTGVNGAFAAADPADILLDMITMLKVGYLQGSSWVSGRGTISTMRKFKSTDDQYLWQPGLTAGAPNTLLGYNVVTAEDVPVMATNSYSLLFGNFREAYTIVDRLGISTLRDPFSNKPWVEFYTRKRTGGDVVDYEAYKALKFAA